MVQACMPLTYLGYSRGVSLVQGGHGLSLIISFKPALWALIHLGQRAVHILHITATQCTSSAICVTAQAQGTIYARQT